MIGWHLVRLKGNVENKHSKGVQKAKHANSDKILHGRLVVKVLAELRKAHVTALVNIKFKCGLEWVFELLPSQVVCCVANLSEFNMTTKSSTGCKRKNCHELQERSKVIRLDTNP